MIKKKLLHQSDVSNIAQQELETHSDPAIIIHPEYQTIHSQINEIVEGIVREIRGDEVMVDIGSRNLGIININEWRDGGSLLNLPHVGDKIPVLLETRDGVVSPSYRKAKRQTDWLAFLAKYKEGDAVTGLVTRKIKGGLLVNIGINVFLPASQIDIRRPADIGAYVNRHIECKIVKIDGESQTVVVSRRKLIEQGRLMFKSNLLREIEPGQIRKGVVKNIAEFGAFVDLGGLDGVLHITDMAWHRVKNPHELVKIDEELEVFVISVDKERERIALGLKQKTANPWQSIEAKYPIGSRHRAKVVDIVSFGVWVRLESGIVGLVHISEMSWTLRINDPKEVVAMGQELEIQVLNINREKKEIALGIRQCQDNPWERIPERYLPGTVITGSVRILTTYGGFHRDQGRNRRLGPRQRYGPIA